MLPYVNSIPASWAVRPYTIQYNICLRCHASHSIRSFQSVIISENHKHLSILFLCVVFFYLSRCQYWVALVPPSIFIVSNVMVWWIFYDSHFIVSLPEDTHLSLSSSDSIEGCLTQFNRYHSPSCIALKLNPADFRWCIFNQQLYSIEPHVTNIMRLITLDCCLCKPLLIHSKVEEKNPPSTQAHTHINRWRMKLFLLRHFMEFHVIDVD